MEISDWFFLARVALRRLYYNSYGVLFLVKLTVTGGTPCSLYSLHYTYLHFLLFLFCSVWIEIPAGEVTR